MLKRTLISACTAAFIGLSGAALAGGHGEKPEANPWTNFALQNTLNKMPAGNAANVKELSDQWKRVNPLPVTTRPSTGCRKNTPSK
jgi:hypothetical protein